MSGTITNHIGKLARENQFTVIGDMDHSDPAVSKYVHGLEVMQALKDAGVKHVFVELPRELQHVADDLANGRITKDQYIKQMSKEMDLNFVADPKEVEKHHGRMADMIVFAKKNGMRVDFADDGTGTNAMVGGPPPSPELTKMIEESATASLKKAGLPVTGKADQDVLKAVLSPRSQEDFFNEIIKRMDALPEAQRSKIIEEVQGLNKHVKDGLTQRFDDRNLYDHVTSVSGGQKSAIIYGGHHDHLRDLMMQKGHKVGNIDIQAGTGWNGTYDGISRQDANGYLGSDKVEKTQTADDLNKRQSEHNARVTPPAPSR